MCGETPYDLDLVHLIGSGGVSHDGTFKPAQRPGIDPVVIWKHLFDDATFKRASLGEFHDDPPARDPADNDLVDSLKYSISALYDRRAVRAAVDNALARCVARHPSGWSGTR